MYKPPVVYRGTHIFLPIQTFSFKLQPFSYLKSYTRVNRLSMELLRRNYATL